jgi:hypothetical protein
MKIFKFLILLFLILTMAGCNITPVETEETPIPTEEIYTGPLFSSIELALENYIEADNLFKTGTNVSGNKLLSNEKEYPGIIINDNYVTFIGNTEYFILEILQPEEVADFYIVESVTLRSNLWTTDKKFIRGSGFLHNSLLQQHEEDVTKVYLPIILTKKETDYVNFTVIAVQYIDSTEIKDMRFSSKASTEVDFYIGNRDLAFLDVGLLRELGQPFKDEMKVTLSIDQYDGQDLKIYIYDILYPEIKYAISGKQLTIDLPTDMELKYHWIKIHIEYEMALEIIEEKTFYVFESNDWNIEVGDLETLILVSTGNTGTINLIFPTVIFVIPNDLILNGAMEYQIEAKEYSYVIIFEAEEDRVLCGEKVERIRFTNVVFSNNIYMKNEGFLQYANNFFTQKNNENFFLGGIMDEFSWGIFNSENEFIIDEYVTSLLKNVQKTKE